MIKEEKVLEVDIEDAIVLFEINKWKFWEVDSEEKIIKIEVPRGYSEVYVVELPFSDERQQKELTAELRKNGFIKQTLRTRRRF